MIRTFIIKKEIDLVKKKKVFIQKRECQFIVKKRKKKNLDLKKHDTLIIIGGVK